MGKLLQSHYTASTLIAIMYSRLLLIASRRARRYVSIMIASISRGCI